MKAIFSIQLMSALTGAAIIAAGGTVYVATAGATAKLALVTHDTFATLANPITPTRGNIRFAVDAVSPLEVAVDLYGLAPGGQAFVARGVKPGMPTEIFIDTSRREQMLVVPFSIADTAANTETDTGFDFTTGMQIRPYPTIYVSALDAGMTIDAGLLSSEGGGDADGFIDGVSLANLGTVDPTFATAVTQGALLRVTATGAGAVIPESYVIGATAKSLTYTLSASTDTGAGFLQIPYVLPANL